MAELVHISFVEEMSYSVQKLGRDNVWNPIKFFEDKYQAFLVVPVEFSQETIKLIAVFEFLDFFT